MQDLNPHLSGFKAPADPLCPVHWQHPAARPPSLSHLCPTPPKQREISGGEDPISQPPREPASPSTEPWPSILFSVAHTPHLQQPEPGLDGDRRVAMATAHGILTWGPAGIAREGQAWPQRDGWRAEDGGPGGTVAAGAALWASLGTRCYL